MKHYILPLLVFLLTLSMPQAVSAEKIPPGVLMILTQAEQVYIKPIGKTTKYYYLKNPVSYASILGLTFHRQVIYAKQKRKYKKELNTLAKELYAYIKHLAKVHHYKNPRNGKPMSEKFLLSKFQYAAKGKMNEWVIKNKGIDPRGTQVSMILDKMKDTGVVYDFHEQEDNKGIVLLGQEVEGAAELAGDICPQYSKTKKEEREKLVRVGAKIDTNNNPDDRTYIKCEYDVNPFKDTLLQEKQTPYKEGNKDGVYLRYLTHTDGTRYIHDEVPYKNGLKHGTYKVNLYMPDGRHPPRPFLFTQTPYENGKRKGIAKSFGYSELGERHEKWITPYENDKINGVRLYYNVVYTKRPYLSSRITYKNGKKHGLEIDYERDGRTIKSKHMYHNGKLVK